MKAAQATSRSGGRPLRRAVVLSLAVLLALPLAAQAHHPECPATLADLTLRVAHTGVYVHGGHVFQESNGHTGLQQGELPEGCAADAQLA